MLEEDGAKHRPIDSHLFWGRQHLIDDHNHVVTVSGEPVSSDLPFLTEEVDAFLSSGWRRSR